MTIESTTKVISLSGIPVRVWEGSTEWGVKCHAYIPLVACDAAADVAEFLRAK